MIRTFALIAALLLAMPAAAAQLRVEGTRFLLDIAPGRTLASEQLVGAVFDMVTPEGEMARVRIDGTSIAVDAKGVVLHDLKVEGDDGQWHPMCEADAQGRRAAFPMAGRWDGQKFIAEKDKWFLTCTSGSQAKCLLWGYDPWGFGPKGTPLVAYYQACQHLVRADYDGRGNAHTRDGTGIDIWDEIGVQAADTVNDPAYLFEAGWGPDGAVCVAKTRWAGLLPLATLLASAPRLKAAPCDLAEARRRGGLIFNRSRVEQ